MNRIRLLPEQVANQIAAGEVVERPASVVKELVENALDAQARRITVEVQAGGRSLIRVTDDGTGMSRDDALLSLERHATSKIRRAEDLAAIATMGFRGEALPSIASVSRFTLTTREREPGPFVVPPSGGSASANRVNAELRTQTHEGTQIVIAGGKILEVKAAGSAPGTSVEVRQLFFNLPARRKFLRSEETEAAHIQHYLTLAALAFPEVAFTFHKDGRLVWQLPAARGCDAPSPAPRGRDAASRLAALRERLRALYGDERRFLTVDFTAAMQSPEDDAEFPDPSPLAPRTSSFRVWGFLGAPGVSRATREDQHLFVNRRPVENRGLNFALLEGYHTALMKGRYPVCCLFLEIDPAAVDVNIHPAKREVKFHREFDVRRLVTQAVRQTLLAFHAGEDGESPKAKGQSPKSEAAPEAAKSDAQAALPNFLAKLSPASVVEPATRPVPPSPAGKSFAPVAQAAPPPVPQAGPEAGAPSRSGVRAESAIPKPPVAELSTHHAPRTPEGAPSASRHPPSSPPAPPPLLDVPLRLIGVVGRLYVLFESDRGLVLMDQHAAHERVLFEQVLERMERGDQSPAQKLLLPETVELSVRDATFLHEQLPALVRLGVGLSEFGERTFLLDALPPFVKVSNARRFVLDLVDELKAAGREVNALRLGEHTVAKTVCRHAVKANDPLAGAELLKLVEGLRRCTMPYTCPHGRPTLIELNYRELEKKFGRLQ
jgi:DNA mismatch repair protein MutL